MKKRFLFVLCVILPLAFTSCDLFLAPVSLSVAKEAFTASVALDDAAWNYTPIKIDNGSNPNYEKWSNSAGTVTWEGNYGAANAYPHVYQIMGYKYVHTASGYSLSGGITETFASSTYVTYDHNLNLSHGTKPVEKITGTLTFSGGAWSGSLKFNNDTYDYSEFAY